ncbi:MULTISPECIES: hypothetical protein [Bacillus cereus group]|uniref:Uncharacterized protein n=1 Tax=Bacillus thuringiensis TaxID=1428 RepID=A0A9X6WJX3_BACTU|nr:MULTISPECIES: hypothetical protein [Bacillus cereus group]MDA1675496.1 hypothetical protein [Bacillus cereus group sp. TH152-1LC]PFJ33205.1 hypothetical protein COJ15_28600 [Bacillus thuringiensis]
MTKYFELEKNDVIEFDYINWKGEKGKRKALVRSVVWGSNEWHKEQQFLLRAIDMEKNDVRYFALKDMDNVKISE